MHPARRLGDPVATFLVEGFWPDATVDAFTAATDRLDESVDHLRQEGIVIRTVAAMLVPSDEAAYWIVDGPSADVVALVYRRAGMSVERIVSALEFRGWHTATAGPRPPVENGGIP